MKLRNIRIDKSTHSGLLTLIVSGTSGGKTTYLTHLINKLHDLDTRFYLFTGNSSAMAKQLPACFIYVSPAKEKIVEVLDNIWETQIKYCKIKHFIRSKLNTLIDMLKDINVEASERLKNISDRVEASDMDDSVKLGTIVIHMRKIAREYYDKLIENYKNKDDQIFIKAMINMGYKAVIIFDDVTEVLDELLASKKLSVSLKAFTCKSRHYDTSILYAVHSPSTANTLMRNNARIIVWGNQQDMLNSMELRGYPKELIKKYKDKEIKKLQYDKIIFVKDHGKVYNYSFKPYKGDKKLGIRRAHYISNKYKDKSNQSAESVAKIMNIKI